MKKIIAAFLFASLAAVSLGCGASENTATVPDELAPMPTAPVTEMGSDTASGAAAPAAPASGP